MPVARQFYVYILTNEHHTVLYVGMTNHLERRIAEHKKKLLPGLGKRNNAVQLVYYEAGADEMSAILRERALKDWNRGKKAALIVATNPTWNDLSAAW